jgi:pimeloyl-ACP methyl ester carboxylesterase
MNPTPNIRRPGLLLALSVAILVIAGCSAQPARTASEPRPYSLWREAEHLGRESRLALVRKRAALREPRIYLNEPFDPSKRTVVTLHGLGSNPNVWAPLVAALDADPNLDGRYQVWQVFYPTNVAIPENRRTIRQALLDAFAALDPSGTAPASRGVTLVGHSMGGVIARLLVVDSGEALWNEFFGRPLGAEERERHAVLAPYLDLKPLPQVGSAIFLAAPHRGAPMAGDWRGRAAAFVVRLPVTTARSLASIADSVANETPLRAAALRQRRNSITNLSDRDDYLRATAELPVVPEVTSHSIIARRDADGPLAESSDGVVPYASAHLESAASELVVASRHSVYDAPAAIAEMRRILTANLTNDGERP